MARIRSIKPEVMSDPKAARLSDAAWRLWVCMWCLADDAGRLQADPDWLNAQVFWAKPRDIEDLLDELSARGRIILYESSTNERLCQVTNFNKHQRIDKPSPSKYEAPKEDSQKPRRGLHESSPTAPGGIGREGKGEDLDQGPGRERETHAGARVEANGTAHSWLSPEKKPEEALSLSGKNGGQNGHGKNGHAPNGPTVLEPPGWFRVLWREHTGVGTPDPKDLLAAYCCVAMLASVDQRPEPEVAASALAVFVPLVGSWKSGSPTPYWFVQRWDMVQAEMVKAKKPATVKKRRSVDDLDFMKPRGDES